MRARARSGPQATRAVVGQQDGIVRLEKRLDRIARAPACRSVAYGTTGTSPISSATSGSTSAGIPSPATAKPVAVGGWACTTAPQSRRRR